MSDFNNWDEDDLETIDEGDQQQLPENEELQFEEEGERTEEAGAPADDNDDADKAKRRKVTRNPQPKLDVELLKGRRGLLCIERLFDRVKFKGGRGHEEQDLDVIIKTYEYWCHRLFPKYPFDDCVSKLEKLGSKKATQTYLKRIRTDMLFDNEELLAIGDDPPQPDDDPPQPDDDLTSNVAETGESHAFDQLFSTPALPLPAVEITDEQLERIRLNRERAERLRLEKKRSAASAVPPDDLEGSLPSQQHDDSFTFSSTTDCTL